MSSAKRIRVEEVIQQVEDEDFDFFFEGSDEDFTHQIPRPYLKTSDENFYYVPFLKSLEIFLKRSLVFDEVSYMQLHTVYH